MLSIHADDYQRFAAKLRAAPRTVQRVVRKRLRDIANPLAADVLREGASVLPHSGGLSDHVLNSAYRRNNMAGSGVRIRLGSRAAGLGMLDFGYIRHPVFADPTKGRDDWTWTTQRIPEGAFSEPFQAKADEVREQMLKVMDEFLNEVVS